MLRAGERMDAGASPHAVTSNPGTLACAPTSTENFNSGNMAPGATFGHTFNTQGSYSYHCEVHGCHVGHGTSDVSGSTPETSGWDVALMSLATLSLRED